VLISLNQREIISGSSAPDRKESVTREVLFQPCEEFIEVHRGSIREDKQAHGIRRHIGREALGDTLAGTMRVGTKPPR